MTEKRIKTTLMLIGEALVIWYGMGTPIPTNLTDGLKLIVALLAITYTGWKNHDFTIEGITGTTITREMKALKDHEWETAEEPVDSYIDDDDNYEVFEYGGESDGKE